MNVNNTVSIIGIGDGGKEYLSNRAILEIGKAGILIGGERHLAFFPESAVQKIAIKKDLARLVDIIKIEGKKKRIAVLASGDPLFFGIGKYFVKNLPEFRLEFFPYPSSLQLAFARIGENWDDAALTSVHAGDTRQLLPLLRRHEKIGILTDLSNTPAKIASLAMEAEGDVFTCFVCENLEGKKERITKGSLKKIKGMEFSPLNVMVLLRKKEGRSPYPFFGMPDLDFAQRKPSRGLITKSEVRAVALSKMSVRPDSIVWDVGAGSGSVSVEAASFAERGRVYSIEKNIEDLEIIKKNIRRFSMPHVIPVHGTAPGCFDSIKEDPDVLFVGGSGGKMEDILMKGISRLTVGGRFVINLIALENLERASETLRRMELAFEILSLNIGRSKGIQGMTMLEGLNPVLMVYGRKEEKN
jgi:precorrin-6Y C5,15-methyltransferase (decarboxylating)